MNSFHDAPFLRIIDHELLRKFLAHFGIAPDTPKTLLVNQIAAAFSHIPYENLTKIIKAETVISARSAMRYPDELLGDRLRWGTGGTCFSLAAAIIAVYDALGIECHPVLADRHYGPDTHCGLVIVNNDGLLLIDPGYLFFIPTLLPRVASVSIDTGDNAIELKPLCGGSKVELWTIAKNNRKLRLTYKTALVDDETFGRAWENSFAWEMMTYPVLTRRAGENHLYIQGSRARMRSPGATKALILTPESQGNFITQNLGISPEIVARAFGVLSHGATPSPNAR